MNNSLKATEEYLQKSVESHSRWKTVEIIPWENSSGLVNIEQNDTTTIGIPKKLYFSIFKECHSFWHKYVSPDICGALEKCKCDDNWSRKMYVMTLGFLLTTNENHTIIKLHETIIWIWVKHLKGASDLMRNEWDIVTTLLSSRLKRINKSPSLWYWMKKLSVVLIFDKIIGDERDYSSEEDPLSIYFLLLDRCFESCRLHLSNYYAGNFLKFCIRLNNILLRSELQDSSRVSLREVNDYIETKLVHSCHENLADVSLWTTLEALLESAGTVSASFDYTVDEYNNVVRQLGQPHQIHTHTLTFSILEKAPSMDIKLFVRTQLAWLLGVNCSVKTPYISLLRQYRQLDKIDSEIHSLLSDTISQEKQKLLHMLQDEDNSLYKLKESFIYTLLDIEQYMLVRD